MFDNSPVMAEGSAERCKPDYEAQAARLRARIVADKKCLFGMRAGVNGGSIDLTRDQSVLYYAVIGKLTLLIPQMEKEYDNLLKEIEKEK